MISLLKKIVIPFIIFTSLFFIVDLLLIHKTKSKILNVPLINQLDAPRLYNGCEVTSLAMVLNYNGYYVTKNELANNIKTVPLTYPNGLKGQMKGSLGIWKTVRV